MKSKRLITIVLFLFLVLCLTSCAPAGPTEYEYGFFSGVWHSFISPISVIGSAFSSEIAVYAVTNNGFWYYSGCAIELIVFCVIMFRK
ncbi:hypothetical protein [Salinimicrobium marinum]|uniref:hypothetical protein n=1 Tax=Salinimicrobium marinum TaxID=680283 RepID=UPI00167579EA|nr:hypothetical protein [Salinimicrobium marinum]